MSLTPHGILEGMTTTLALTLSAPDECIGPAFCSDSIGLHVSGVIFAVADAPVKDVHQMSRASISSERALLSASSQVA